MASVRKQLNLDRCWVQWNAMHSTTIAFSGNHRGIDWWFEQTHYRKFKWQIQPMMQYNDWNGFVSLDFRKTDDNNDIRHRHWEPFERIRVKFRQLSEAIGVSSDLVCKRFEIVWNFGESLEFDPKMSPLIISTLTVVWSIEFRVGHRCLIKIIKAKQNDYCNSSLVGRADGEKIRVAYQWIKLHAIVAANQRWESWSIIEQNDEYGRVNYHGVNECDLSWAQRKMQHAV